LSIIFTSSCRSVRLLDDDQALVTKVKLEGIDKKFKEQAEEYVQKEIRPNSPINLFIYNLANAQNGHYRIQNIRNVGAAPSILDSSLVDISSVQIKKYLNNKGFLNAKVNSAITVHNKKAKIVFKIDQGAPFIIGKLNYDIEDPAIEEIYQKSKPKFTRIHIGEA
jgi:outer membrane protein assembly factor BamA